MKKIIQKIAFACTLTVGIITAASFLVQAQETLGQDGNMYNYEDCLNGAGKNVGSCVAKVNGNCTTEITCKKD